MTEANHREPDERTDAAARGVVAAAMRIHRELGNGLLESAYEICLAHLLRTEGLDVRQQASMPVVFDGVDLGTPYRLDLVVDARLVVEIKGVDRILPIHEAQILSYPRLGNFHLGLLLNFHAPLMRDGIRRFINPAWRPGK